MICKNGCKGNYRPTDTKDKRLLIEEYNRTAKAPRVSKSETLRKARHLKADV